MSCHKARPISQGTDSGLCATVSMKLNLPNHHLIEHGLESFPNKALTLDSSPSQHLDCGFVAVSEPEKSAKSYLDSRVTKTVT